ncbi:MAG: Imidazolonepropionase [Gemmatimonadaceae bacterium]|nr:Imidazolonepropionase [Gemmatimonadaceae bacterium]
MFQPTIAFRHTRMTRPALTASVSLLLALPAAAQTIAITGGRVFPVSSAPIENGTVLIRDGRIVAVGANVTIPADAQRIDASGKWVTPGIFNSATALGIMEVGAVQNTVDVGARGKGDGITASFRAWEGFNPASPLLQVTRNDGITTVGVLPGGNMISGQAAVFDLSDSRSRTEMLLRAPVALIADLTSTGTDRGASRGEVLQRFRDVLSDARDFPRRRAEYERAQSRELSARKADLEALLPVVQGRTLLILNAERASDIQNALQLAKEFSLRIAISGATEAWKVADELAAAKVPVIVGALSNIPRDFSTLGARQDNAALLQKAGVRVIVNDGTDAFNARNVKYSAGVAVSFGLPWDEALRAVTINPAELYGVSDRVGTLEAGKDATLVIWNGDPFELSTRPEHVLVRGNDVLRPSRQDELVRRYRRLPADYRGRP